MNARKQIEVGASAAMVELKAELHRKQNELRSQPTNRGVSKSLNIRNEVKGVAKLVAGQNRGIEKRSEKDVEEKKHAETTYERAKYVLEQKAKLYDKMNAEALSYDEDHPVLVNSLIDFQRKAIDRVNEDRFQPTHREIIQDNQDWTDYTDSLGRTRRILKSELAYYISQDKELNPPEPNVPPEISQDELLRLEKHEKWEQQAAELAEKSKVHYQDILFDEIREHGTGYYEFSKDNDRRAIQLAQLKKLSEETEASRKKIEAEKKGKKSQLKERLKKIRARKRAKLGLVLAEEDESESEEEEPMKEEKIDVVEDLKISKLLPDELRAWDFGKPGVYGIQPKSFDELDAKWLKDRREDRKSDFAPPTTYLKNPKATVISTSTSGNGSSTGKYYDNFVKPEESNSMKMKPTKKSYEPITSQQPRQKFQPIVDELPAPTKVSDFERGYGNEIAPPPTYDYYHGETGRRTKTNSKPPTTVDVSEAIAQGIDNFRKQMEERQLKSKSYSDKS